jgi:cysteine desulfurase/selenocysteine lyase
MKDYDIYLDTAAAGIVSKHVLQTSHIYDETLHTAPSSAFFTFLEDDYPRIKKNVADFCGVDSHHLAFIPNFSYGLTTLLPSLQKKHSRVLLFEDDYPSLTLPFQLHEFDVYWLPSHDGYSWDLNELEDALAKHKIEILAISHVQYLTGAKLEITAIAEICKRLNVLLVVDATQSLGAIPLHFDRSGIDVLITSNYKWMNGGFGSGLMCFRTGFFEDYPPTIGGFGSYKNVEDGWKYVPSSASYQPGHFNFGLLLLLEQAIKEKTEMGMETLEAHNMKLATRFVDGVLGSEHKLIGPKNMDGRSSIICIEAPKDLHQQFENARIRCTYRNNSIRFAFHFTNTQEDLAAALGIFKKN